MNDYKNLILRTMAYQIDFLMPFVSIKKTTNPFGPIIFHCNKMMYEYFSTINYTKPEKLAVNFIDNEAISVESLFEYLVKPFITDLPFSNEEQLDAILKHLVIDNINNKWYLGGSRAFMHNCELLSKLIPLIPEPTSDLLLKDLGEEKHSVEFDTADGKTVTYVEKPQYSPSIIEKNQNLHNLREALNDSLKVIRGLEIDEPTWRVVIADLYHKGLGHIIRNQPFFEKAIDDLNKEWFRLKVNFSQLPMSNVVDLFEDFLITRAQMHPEGKLATSDKVNLVPLEVLAGLQEQSKTTLFNPFKL